MKIKFLIYMILTAPIFINAQNIPFYKSYDWNQLPNFLLKHDEQNNVRTLKEKIVKEFLYSEEGSLEEYSLTHRILWLNSDEAIEDFNKVYIPYAMNSEILVSKARVIQNDGKINILDDSSLLSATDEEKGREYRYFAFDGIEKGSLIEYLYVIKKTPEYNGKRWIFQSSHEKENVEFELYAPTNLIFKFKSYNGLPEVKKDTLHKEKLKWFMKAKKLKAIAEEEMSAYDASLASMVYKLDENLTTKKVDISSYTAISKGLYNFYYPKEYSKKTMSLIDNFLSSGKLKKFDDKDRIISSLEHHVKRNVYLSNSASKKYNNLENVLENNIANEVGILKLYVALFRKLGIEHQMIITTNRQKLKFDESFEAHNFLTDFLFFFPFSEKYLSPSDKQSRYGFPPAYLTDNYGLFIKEVKIGNFKSGVGKIKYIESVKGEYTSDVKNINVSLFKDDFTKMNIEFSTQMTGYYAMYLQPFLDIIKEDRKKELLNSFVKRIDENAEIDKIDFKNDNPKLFGKEPLIINATFTTNSFVEKAGEKYLLKVGELIGPQIELYQEKVRKLGIENDFHRSYFRTIKIEIPKEFKLLGLDKLNIDNSYQKNGQKLLSFKSFYNFKNNELIIKANEFYKKNILDVSEYEEYRKVINSAADFNKIVLILEPQ